jgi:hypothetical protein
MTPPPSRRGRARLAIAQRPGGLALRNASQVGRRPLPLATVVYRARAPRDSAQSP